jgi:hypothetical protein
LSIAPLALSLFPDNKDFALSSRPISLSSSRYHAPPSGARDGAHYAPIASMDLSPRREKLY